MAVQTKDALVGVRPVVAGSGFAPRRVLGRDWAAAWLFLAPCMLVIVGLIAYPFVSAIVLSFQAKLVGSPAVWVGFDNYVQLLTGRDLSEQFWQALRVTVTFTVVAIAAKLVLGMSMALLLNEPFAGRSGVRAFFFLPWAVPTLIAGLTWKWMYDGSQVGLLNMLVIRFGLSTDLVQWLGNYNLALWAVVVAVVWTSTPFFSMMLLAGLQAIPGELYEAAKIDGAGIFGRFRHVTLPSLTNIIVITTLLSSIWTATSINLVYVLTGGGPANATMTVPLLSYEIGVAGAQRLGMGATISLVFFPIFLVMIVFLTRRMLHEDR